MNLSLPLHARAAKSAISPRKSLLRTLSSFVAVGILLTVLPCYGQTSAASSDPTLAAMNRKLASIVVPNVEFRATTMSNVIDFLIEEARRVDPAPESGPTGRGVNIVFIYPRKTATNAEQPKRITMTLKDAPILEVLRQSAEQVGMSVSVHPYDVRIVPAQPGAVGDTVTLVQTTPGSKEAVAIQQKLEATILPEVEFRGTSLGEITGYLNKQGAALPEGGIKFFLAQTNPPRPEAGRSTLALSRIPMLELLRLVCLQTGTKAQITLEGVAFVAGEGK